jgi:hypothetical protein
MSASHKIINDELQKNLWVATNENLTPLSFVTVFLGNAEQQIGSDMSCHYMLQLLWSDNVRLSLNLRDHRYPASYMEVHGSTKRYVK